MPEVPQTVNSPAIEEPRDYNMSLTMSGVKVRGRIDLRNHPVNGHFFILDWKSCKNFTYCQTPETLARDPQGIIYLQYGFQLYPEAKTGDFRHIYLRTQEPFGARAVVTDPMSRDQVQDVFGHLEKTVSEMKSLAAEKDPSQVPFDKTSCSKYGGCPYRNVCPAVERFNPLNITESKNMNETQTPPPEMSSLARKLAERKNKPSGIINPPDAAPPHEVKPYELPAVVQEREHLNLNPPVALPDMQGHFKDVIRPMVKYGIVVQASIDSENEFQGQPFVLCLNSMPEKGPYRKLNEIVVSAVRSATEHPNFQTMEGTWVLDSEELIADVLEVFHPIASQVFRGR